MSGQAPDNIMSFQSSEAIGVHKAVKQGAAQGDVDIADTAGELCVGVNLNAATAANKQINVVTSGSVKVECGTAIAIGDELVCDVNGDMVPVALQTGVHILGIALQAAADGDIFEMLIQRRYVA